MTDDKSEPDAWLFHMEEDVPYKMTCNMVPAEKDRGYNWGVHREEPLYSAETIKEQIDSFRQEIEDTRQKYFDEGNNAVNPQAIREIKKFQKKLTKLEQVFSQE